MAIPQAAIERLIWSSVLLLAMSAPGARAQELSLASRTVSIIVGYGTGGGYDLYGRVLARHLGRHLPGTPSVVVSNMPGAGSITATNHLYNVSARDGTALGIVAQSIAEEELAGTPGVRYEAARFNWIGRFSPNVEVSYVWHTVPVKSVADLKRRETTFAGTGPSSRIYPGLLNAIAGMRWKLILGYNTTSDAHLALQRGEVEGATSSINTLRTREAAWLREDKVRILVQFALQRSPGLGEVPAVTELAERQADKDVLAFYAASASIGRAVIAPPGLSEDRVRMLRAAFDAAMRDAGFLAEVQATGLEHEPMSGEELQKLVVRAAGVSDEVRRRAKAARGP